MEIRETLFKKTFSIDSSDMYGTALEIMHHMSNSYKLYEKKNLYETDGPVKKCFLDFDVVQTLDKFSYIIIHFSLEGENGTLYAEVVGDYVVYLKEEGFFSSLFTEFYVRDMFPEIRRISEDKMKEMEVIIDHI